MADYVSIQAAPNGAPVQVAAATEAVTWFARRGTFAVSTKSTAPNPATDGVIVPQGFGVDIATGLAVWYWVLGSDPAIISREAL